MDAYVNHAFNTSVRSVFQEFKRGFFQLCDRDLVKLFHPNELQEVLVGKDYNDWAKLKQVQSKIRTATDLSHPRVLDLNPTSDYSRNNCPFDFFCN